MFDEAAQWRIVEHKTRATRGIERAPRHVQGKYEFWKELMQCQGPEAVRKFSGFRDHPLKGWWRGCRSSSLNDQYRVMYRIDVENATIHVEKIGPHNY